MENKRGTSVSLLVYPKRRMRGEPEWQKVNMNTG